MNFCYSPYYDAEIKQCLKIDLKVAQTQLLGYNILYIVTEKTLGSLSRIVSSVRFKTGSQKEIKAIALNKTGTQCIYQCFPPELEGWGGHTLGITQPMSYTVRMKKALVLSYPLSASEDSDQTRRMPGLI